MLYVFEDNEAVIKIFIKGKSPTMRHVSRTHRVALDWLFERINLDPEIQHFTRDEWNNLLYLFNISHFSSLSLLRSEFQLNQLHQNDGDKDARTKRRQQDCGKIRANGDEPGRHCLDKFFICGPSDCVEKPGDRILQSTGWMFREA